jgi:ethanolamine ammonia-lyase small subunit
MSNDQAPTAQSALAKPTPHTGESLQRYTSARVSLGHSGPAIPLREHLRFQLDHALARDAVHMQLDVTTMLHALRHREMDCLALHSAVPSAPADNRQLYLRRPDLGRILHSDSRETLRNSAAGTAKDPDTVFVIADGLSALAVERHAVPLLDCFFNTTPIDQRRVGPVCVVSQGRVAIADEIGADLHANLSVVLIGERPGLSAPDSLGVYITWKPRPGRTDAERNCISNIRQEGLSYADAAQRMHFYIAEARRLQTTGVTLKEGQSSSLPLTPES